MQIEKTSCPGQPVGELSVWIDTQRHPLDWLSREAYIQETQETRGKSAAQYPGTLLYNQFRRHDESHRDRTFVAKVLNSMSTVQSNVLVRCSNQCALRVALIKPTLIYINNIATPLHTTAA
jgi:hypothetical protein